MEGETINGHTREMGTIIADEEEEEEEEEDEAVNK